MRRSAQFLALFLGIFCPCSLALAQAGAGANISDIVGQKENKIASERIRQALQRETAGREQVGKKAGEIIKEKSKEINQGSPGSIHPYFQNDGAGDDAKTEYTQKDTEAIFNGKTAAACMEDRQVETEPFMGQCAHICPGPHVIPGPQCQTCTPGRDPNCVPNYYYVSELYFPVYQARVYKGRGMGNFDPKGSGLSGADQRSDLAYKATQQRMQQKGMQAAEETYQKYFRSSVQAASGESLQSLIPPEVKKLDYAFSDRGSANNFSEPEVQHVLVYQTNSHKESTRNRPEEGWKGYELEEKCFYHTLDNPSKEVISRATFDDEAIKLGMRAYETKQVPKGSEALKATVLDEQNVFSLAQKIDGQMGAGGNRLPQLMQQLPPSQRMQKWNHMRQGLQRAGFQQSQLKRDFVIFADEFAPYDANEHNDFTTPLFAAVIDATKFFKLSGMKNVPGNTNKRRAIQFALYKGREGESKSDYTQRYPLSSKIVHTGKIQVIYPPKKPGGGEREGSQCFRPESLARDEKVDTQNELDERTKDLGYVGLRRDMERYFPLEGVDKGLGNSNEVRVAFWQKRVNCYCTQCARPGFTGCVNLHDGDLEEDDFFGGEKLLATQKPTLYRGGTKSSAGTNPLR